MRCARCHRRVRKARAARLPDGRLAFSWCGDCLATAHLRALGLDAAGDDARPPGLPETGREAVPDEVSPAADEGRPAGLRGLGVLLTAWGLLLQLVGAGSWLGLGGPDDGFGPTRVGRAEVFAVSGAMLAVGGAWLGLASLDRGVRARALARAVEAAALGLGLSVLVIGIAFHDRNRDPWVVGGVLLAAASARAARLWSRHRGRPARPLASG